ncbi:hypothetical protein MVEN_00219500 [Mycena venus]|uniref:Protein kinase domain-containing protein n=1 Tax=Mycena venus TaxID=2733690 RepID=A0A8H6YYQ0_9AGAR|nr:hypothetical protein MVEN_00219500 [Mycena venus]
MSTLELIWDSKHTWSLWSWNSAYGNIHYTAQLVRPIKKSVYMVRIGNRGMEPTDVVALKVARGSEAVEEMEREAGFYEHQLRDLQGTVVPKCYGFYTAKVRGMDIGCLLLEYCSGPPGRDFAHIRSQSQGHASYICSPQGGSATHGDLAGGHHFIPMGHDVRIVDFSVAVPHKCVSGLSKRAAGHRHHICGCHEIAVLENVYARHLL